MNYDIQNWSRAAELYGRLLTLEPNDPDTMTDLGISLRNLGRREEALELFRETRSLHADYWPALFNEILVLAYDLGQGEEAKEKLAELRALQPSNPRVEQLAQDLEERFGA
jgi:Flp pilus assembly protein TadD